jgi:hypothetical protein
MRRLFLLVLVAAFVSVAAPAADWQNFFANGLSEWEILGDGIWELRPDGVLLAYRRPDKAALFSQGDSITRKQFHAWDTVQSWLYTRKEYGEFDLRLEYWVRTPGNSGISIRDPSRAKYGLTLPPDFSKTPSKLGYEIQINSEWPDPKQTGSIYGLADAPAGLQRPRDWNSLHVVSRGNKISVFVNGLLAAEHPGDPNRPKTGPIGLQLHDQSSVVMFRNVWLREQ